MTTAANIIPIRESHFQQGDGLDFARGLMVAIPVSLLSWAGIIKLGFMVWGMR